MAEPLQQFMTKWGNGFATTPANIALMEADKARLARGKAPLTSDQTLIATMAAQKREPITPLPEKNPFAIFQNAATDVTELMRGLPRLPGMVLRQGIEAIQDPTSLVRIPEGGNIADMPALMYLPGAFTASALLPGGVPAGDIATRPVTTALDILPFASKGIGLAAERGLAQVAPDLRYGSYQSAQALRKRLQDVTQAPNAINASALSPFQRRAVQATMAAGEGKRVIPDLLTRRIYFDELGRGFKADAHWLNRMRTNPATRGLMQFSPTVRATMSRLRGDESMMVIEGRTTGVPVKARDWSHRFHDTYGDTAVSRQKLEALDNVLSDPDMFGVRTPDEAMDIVAKEHPDLRPWYEEAKGLIEELTDQEFNTKYGEPVIARYEGDGQIYTVEQERALRTADEKLAGKQKVLNDTWNKGFSRVLARLMEENGGDVVEMVRRGDIETAKATLKARKVNRPGARLNAIEKYFDIESKVRYLIDGDLDTFVNTGPVNMQKFGYGKLNDIKGLPNFMTGSEWHSLRKAVAETNKSVSSRLRKRITHRPGVESVTGSRKLWERYQEMFRIARDEMPAKYGPDVWNGYKERYRQIQEMDGDATRRVQMLKLRRELGEDARYLHYVVPDDANWQRYTDTLLRQNLAQQVSKQELDRLTAEVRRSMADMSRNSPYEPAYVPRVPIEKAGKVDNTTIRASYMKPGHAAARSYDYAPMHPDLGVSVTYTSLMDHMARRGVPYMVDQFSKNPALMTEEYLNAMLRAEHNTLRSMGRTDLDVEPDRYIHDAKNSPKAKRFVRFMPEELFPVGSPTRTDLGQLWMPVEFESVVRSAVQDAMSPTTFNKLLDPVTGLFRTSVLLLSPRWHFNNILGNIMMTAMANPRALARIPEEWRRMGGWEGVKQYVKQADAAESGLEASLRGETGYFTEQMRRAGLPGILGAIEQVTMRVHKAAGKEFLEQGLARSRTGIRLWDQMAHSQAWEKMSGGIEKGASASLGFNSFFDDMARRANFEQFYDDAMRELVEDYRRHTGNTDITKDVFENLDNEATRRALTSTQDWFMDWTQMLPIERSFLRTVFPFYSFAAHIMRAAVKYPFDHPARVAIINAITRAEQDDWLSRYPPVFQTLLGWGDPDEQDTYTGLNVNSFNPFRETGEMLTLGGLLGQVNPIMQTVFQQFGIDTMAGGPEYGDNWVYDETDLGGKRYDAGNPIVNLAKNLIPQSELIAQLSGMDSAYRELQRSNPAAANRALLTGLQLPVVWRSLDVNERLASDELKRYSEASDAIKNLDADRVGRFFPKLKEPIAARAREEELRNATAVQLADMVVRSGGGPPHNPLSNFITI